MNTNLIKYQKIFVFVATGLSLLLVFKFGTFLQQSGVGDYLCKTYLHIGNNIDSCNLYLVSDFSGHISVAFLMIAFTGFFIFNAPRQTFKKWLYLTCIFLISTVTTSLIYNNFNDPILMDKTEKIIEFFYVIYVFLSLGFLVRDSFKFSQQEISKEKTERQIRFARNILIGGILVIFFSGFVSPGFWMFTPLFLGIPLVLFTGSVYIVNFRKLGEEKILMTFFLGLLLSVIIFIIFAWSQFHLSMM